MTESVTPKVELPEMPEPLREDERVRRWAAGTHGDDLRPVLSVSEARAYATQAVLAERERCILACQKVRNDLDEYAEKSNYHGDAWSYIDECEAAIRKG